MQEKKASLKWATSYLIIPEKHATSIVARLLLKVQEEMQQLKLFIRWGFGTHYPYSI